MADEINEHKRMAMGQSLDMDDTFGVQPLSSLGKTHPDAGNATHRKTNRDNARSAGTPISRPTGGHGAQANPDHGPHGY